MAGAVLYTIVSVIVVSLIALVGAVPLLFKKKTSEGFLVILLSISVGSLLGSVFIHFLPEAFEHGHSIEVALYVLLGFIIFFILEKFIHWHHGKKCEKGDCGHGHAYHLAPINLLGDGIHNFMDGMVIAGAYIVSIPLGIAATISVIFHELPQEIADFGVLLYSGLSKTRALLLNFASALTAILGAIIGLILAGQTQDFTHFIIPFAAGNFIYIASSNLVPQLHRHCKFWPSVLHIVAIIAGIGIMLVIALLGPAHMH
ncbi:MAG: ZIP family metal transporter [Nanoarchaeota archaeon]|nr:ZIP family metal transporter [Nanoarchaeota archaeon]